MSRRSGRAIGLALIAALLPAFAGAQGLSANISAGRQVYEPVSANVDTNNLLGGLRYDSQRGMWVDGTAAIPLSSRDTFWGSAGLGGRLKPSGPPQHVTFGADLAAHGYTYRDAVTTQRGSGGTVDAFPFVRATAGAGFVEGTAGWRGYTSSFDTLRTNRGVVEVGGRAGYAGQPVQIAGDVRWVRAPEGTYPFAGGTVAVGNARAQMWGQAGRWLSSTLDAAAWGIGGGLSLGVRTTAWATIQQQAPDPLFWNITRHTWSVGLTQRIGRIAASPLPVPHSEPGSTLIRVRVADAPEGQVSVAGDFNRWQPTPMRREGQEWILRVSLAPGVYHYTFRSEEGEWFVPVSTPGRRDDGMGGHEAILVVS